MTEPERSVDALVARLDALASDCELTDGWEDAAEDVRAAIVLLAALRARPAQGDDAPMHSFGHCKDCPGIVSLMCCKHPTEGNSIGGDAPKAGERECQSVWRCAIGDAVAAIDGLKDDWLTSKRKADREAGARLSDVLSLVWAARDPAPSNYSQANDFGKVFVNRILAALRNDGRTSA